MDPNKDWDEVFEALGIKQLGHFELNSGLHSDVYINKDALFQHPGILWDFAAWVVFNPLMDGAIPDIVVGPESGGAKLALSIAFWIHEQVNENVICAYPEKTESGDYVFKRGQGKDLEGKNVLIVDDVLTSGLTLEKVLVSVEENGGIVQGLFVIWNRSDFSEEDFDMPISRFTKESLSLWEKEDCPLCKLDVPLSQEFV